MSVQQFCAHTNIKQGMFLKAFFFIISPLRLIPCINKVAMVTPTFRKVQRIRNCCKVTDSLRLPFEIPPPWCISSSEKLEIECGPRFGGTGCYTNKYPFVKKWPKLYARCLEVRITSTGLYVTSSKVTVQLWRILFRAVWPCNFIMHKVKCQRPTQRLSGPPSIYKLGAGTIYCNLISSY